MGTWMQGKGEGNAPAGPLPPSSFVAYLPLLILLLIPAPAHGLLTRWWQPAQTCPQPDRETVVAESALVNDNPRLKRDLEKAMIPGSNVFTANDISPCQA